MKGMGKKPFFALKHQKKRKKSTNRKEAGKKQPF